MYTDEGNFIQKKGTLNFQRLSVTQKFLVCTYLNVELGASFILVLRKVML